VEWGWEWMAWCLSFGSGTRQGYAFLWKGRTHGRVVAKSRLTSPLPMLTHSADSAVMRLRWAGTRMRGFVDSGRSPIMSHGVVRGLGTGEATSSAADYDISPIPRAAPQYHASDHS